MPSVTWRLFPNRPGQFLLLTNYSEAKRVLEVFQDPEVAVSLTIGLQQLFAFTGTAVPFGVVCWGRVSFWVLFFFFWGESF